MRMKCNVYLTLVVVGAVSCFAAQIGKDIGKSALRRPSLTQLKSASLVSSNNEITPSESNWRGNACIFGGALAHLTFGTMYCWGNFLSYAPDNLKYFDGILHPGVQPDALYVIPLTLI